MVADHGRLWWYPTPFYTGVEEAAFEELDEAGTVTDYISQYFPTYEMILVRLFE